MLDEIFDFKESGHDTRAPIPKFANDRGNL
jgi:hypothetical protein